MKLQLYHGTSPKNADAILKDGFKDRVAANKKNWSGKIISQAGFVYLTTAYPFFYAMNASKGRTASVIKVEVDSKDLYPDEDILRFAGIKGPIELEDYKANGELSLMKLGNVAVKPEAIIRILGRKDFDSVEMAGFSDPSMSPINYRILGAYYRELTAQWWADGEWRKINQTEFLMQ